MDNYNFLQTVSKRYLGKYLFDHRFCPARDNCHHDGCTCQDCLREWLLEEHIDENASTEKLEAIEKELAEVKAERDAFKEIVANYCKKEPEK